MQWKKKQGEKKKKAITKFKRHGLGTDMVMIEGESEDQNMWSMAKMGK